MRSIVGREALWILAFAGIAAAAFGTFYLFAEKAAHPDSLYGRYAAAERKDPGDPSLSEPGTAEVTLRRDRTVAAGEARWTYRGVEEGRVRIDVVVPRMDPDSVYAYYLDPQNAADGFFLSGREYRLLSVRNGRIRFRPIPAPSP